ncbi:MAG TPA: DUF2393 family protein [Acidobacteriaceae bacterium]
MDLQSTNDEQKSGLGAAAWIAAAVVVLVIVGGIVLMAHHRRAAVPVVPPNTMLPLDGYAANLSITGIEMSDTDTFGGGRLIYIDGHITNNGAKTVKGITVQTVFANDLKYPPQVETGPLMLIRTRDPYVDTEMISAEPLKPGDSRDFRLSFEHVYTDWNQTYPEVRVVAVQ